MSELIFSLLIRIWLTCVAQRRVVPGSVKAEGDPHDSVLCLHEM